MNKNKICLLLFSLWSFSCFSQTIEKDKDLRTLVTLLDYISKDYPAAVEDGRVINESEFAEMTDFAEKSIALQRELTPSSTMTSSTALQPPARTASSCLRQKGQRSHICHCFEFQKQNS
ncbi:hypothetical protein [Pontibacter rugosus]